MNLRRGSSARRSGLARRGPIMYSQARFFRHFLRLAGDNSTNYDGMVYSTSAHHLGLEPGHGIPPDTQATLPAARDPRRYRRRRYPSPDPGTAATRSRALGGRGRGSVGGHTTIDLQLAGSLPHRADAT